MYIIKEVMNSTKNILSRKHLICFFIFSLLLINVYAAEENEQENAAAGKGASTTTEEEVTTATEEEPATTTEPGTVLSTESLGIPLFISLLLFLIFNYLNLIYHLNLKNV